MYRSGTINCHEYLILLYFFNILDFIFVSYGFLHAFSSDLKTKKVFFEQIFFPGDSS